MNTPVTPWKVLFEFSTNKSALKATTFGAMDITYKCPECDEDRATTWMFPDVEMGFLDDCCNAYVRFLPKTGSEEE